VLTRHPLLSAAGIPMLLVSLVTASCSGSSVPTADPTRPGEGPPGAQLFVAACASCHGLRGDGGLSGVPLNHSAADRQRIVGAIRYGIGGMPASSAGMSDEEINALAEYVAGLP
jgi:mono/diheme cytochrome c family protein